MRNSTIINKKKKLPCGHFDYNFSKGRCKQCATIQDTQKRVAAHEESEDSESRNNLISDCDIWFSKYIRLKYSNENGFVRCYTSDKEMRWQDAQCGHFISRSHLATRWLEDNARPQSEYDNCHLHGNLQEFEKRLEAEKSGIVEWLKDQAREISKPTLDELKAIASDFRWKTKLLEKKLKKPAP